MEENQTNNMGNISDASAFADDQFNLPSLIKVVGVGGGGCNAVNHMHNQNVDNVTFVVCNTDKQALGNSKVETKLLIGNTVTKGLGAGDKPELGKAAAEASEEEIRNLFQDETDRKSVV